MIDFQIQLLYNRVMLNFNSVKNKMILLIFSFIIFNVIEYYGGDFVVGLVNNVPTGDLRLDVMLNDAAFKVFELFLAVILGFILPVPKYFKIIFSRRTVRWLIILLISSILLSIFNPEHFWEALFIGSAAAFPEEFIFRGIFLGYLLKTFKSSKYGVIISLVISTVLFSVYHFGNISNQNIEATILQMFGVAGIGFMLGCLYVKTGSLLIPMIAHFFFDFFLTIMNGMQVSYKTQQFDPSTISAVILQFLIFLLIGIMILKAKHSGGWRLARLMYSENGNK